VKKRCAVSTMGLFILRNAADAAPQDEGNPARTFQ
jgi:hypothetical protein